MTSEYMDIGKKFATHLLLSSFLWANGSVSAQEENDVTNTGSPDVSTVETVRNSSGAFTESAVTLDPRFPFDSNVGMVAGGAVGLTFLFGALAFRRRTKFAVPLAIAGAGAAYALMNPEMLDKQFVDVKNDYVVVLDRTASNEFADRSEITEQVRQKVLTELGSFKNANIRIVELEDLTQDGKNMGTRLFEALRQEEDLDPENMGGLVLVTDGNVHDVPEMSPYGENVPVHTIITSAAEETDRAIKLAGSPGFGLVGEEQTIRFQVDDLGFQSAEPIRVTITPEGGKAQVIEVNAGEEAQATLDVTHENANIYSIEAQPVDGELTEENNRIVVQIDGIREDLNVLMLSGLLNSGISDMRNFFKSDPDSNLVHFVSLYTQEDISGIKNLINSRNDLAGVRVPLNEIFDDALDKFDLLTFDHFEHFHIIPESYLQGMARRVWEGGSLLVVAGPEFAGLRSLYNSPIGSILPATPTGNVIRPDVEATDADMENFIPNLTDIGQRHPIVRGLDGAGNLEQEPSWGPWIQVVESEVKEGRTLLETPDGKPLLVINDVGEGRVGILLSDSFPLWGMGFEGGGPDAQLLRRISHWLMKTPALEEEALRVYEAGENSIVIERQTLSEDAPPPVTITEPDGDRETAELATQVSPGLWRTQIRYDQAGIYRVSQDNGEEPDFSKHVSVGLDQFAELENVVSTTEFLKNIADTTDGTVTRIQFNDEGALQIPALRQVEFDPENAGLGNEGALELYNKEARALRGYGDRPLIPNQDFWAAMVLALSLFWGASRNNDHQKVKDLGRLLGGRKKDEKSAAEDKPTPSV